MDIKNSDQEKTFLTAATSPSSKDSAPIFFRSMYFYDSPQPAQVWISAMIPPKYAAYSRKNKTGNALNIMGAAYAENGAISARFSDTFSFLSYDAKNGGLERNAAFYQNCFRLKPGIYHIKLGISNETALLGSEEKHIEIPTYPGKELATSSLIVVQRTAQIPELLQNIQSQMLDEADPFIYRGSRIEPSVMNKASMGSVISVMFRLYNLQPSMDAEHLTIKAMLKGETGEIFQGEISSPKEAISREGKTKAIFGLMLSFAKAPAGKYRLILEITQNEPSETVMLETDLELTQ
jgi:hypothetical protein